MSVESLSFYFKGRLDYNLRNKHWIKCNKMQSFIRLFQTAKLPKTQITILLQYSFNSQNLHKESDKRCVRQLDGSQEEEVLWKSCALFSDHSSNFDCSNSYPFDMHANSRITRNRTWTHHQILYYCRKRQRVLTHQYPHMPDTRIYI